ncbi:hypothetical protein NDU88_007379, partial [Pleurodeles waltl]
LLVEYISKSIREIPTPGDAKKEVKCTLHMDDVTLFCTDGKIGPVPAGGMQGLWQSILVKDQRGQITDKALRLLGPM